MTFPLSQLVTNYKKIRALLKQKTQKGLRVALHKNQNENQIQKIWYSYYLMNKLLSGFVDHMFVEVSGGSSLAAVLAPFKSSNPVILSVRPDGLHRKGALSVRDAA